MKRTVCMILCIILCISVTFDVRAEDLISEEQTDKNLTYTMKDLETGQETQYTVGTDSQVESYGLKHPFGAIVMLKVSKKNGTTYIATGTLVNENTVITAAENVYERNLKEYVVDVVVYPGFRKNTGYIGGSQVKTVHVSSAYQDKNNQIGGTYNYAALKLKTKMDVKEYIPLEARIMSESSLLKYKMRKGYYDQQMEFHTIDGNITSISGKKLIHNLYTPDIWKWQGGPIYRVIDGTYYMVGISMREYKGVNYCEGVRIDQTVINFIEKAKNI